jgi:plasmid maintenance system antidote protein VapI
MSTKNETNTLLDKDKFKKMLILLGLKQSDLATKLNVSRQRISNIIAGRNSFTEKQQIILCKEFDVNLNWLIAGVGEMFLNDEEFDKKVEQKVNEILKKQGLTS